MQIITPDNNCCNILSETCPKYLTNLSVEILRTCKTFPAESGERNPTPKDFDIPGFHYVLPNLDLFLSLQSYKKGLIIC